MQTEQHAMRIRNYRFEDSDACLAVFDSNVPEYFLSSERKAFSQFLKGPDFLPPRLREHPGSEARFYVVEDKDEIVGCGGWYLDDTVAGLSWGMVDRSRHRQGLGRLLLEVRLKTIREDGRARSVRVRTTPSVQGFFEHFDFRFVRAGVKGIVDEVPLVELLLAL